MISLSDLHYTCMFFFDKDSASKTEKVVGQARRSHWILILIRSSNYHPFWLHSFRSYCSFMLYVCLLFRDAGDPLGTLNETLNEKKVS
jgi:hypothetical protein